CCAVYPPHLTPADHAPASLSCDHNTPLALLAFVGHQRSAIRLLALSRQCPDLPSAPFLQSSALFPFETCSASMLLPLMPTARSTAPANPTTSSPVARPSPRHTPRNPSTMANYRPRSPNRPRS